MIILKVMIYKRKLHNIQVLDSKYLNFIEMNGNNTKMKAKPISTIFQQFTEL